MPVVHMKKWNLSLGTDKPLFVIAGLNVLENLDLALTVGRHLKDVTAKLGLPYVFKASFDKANRSSIKSYRGPGLKDGLAMLAEVKKTLNVPIATDLHEVDQAEPVAAILCERGTSFGYNNLAARHRRDEAPANSGCGSNGARFQFGMILHADEPGMVGYSTDDLGQQAIGRHAGKDTAGRMAGLRRSRALAISRVFTS
jgi:hypothetical protein